jgi:penicillin-binding protein 2
MATLGESWHQGETLVAGIGQGYVLSTPLQLAVMAARIANGGLRVEPTLSRMTPTEGEQGFLDANAAGPLPTEPPPSIGVSKAHLDAVRRGMFAVSNGPRGTARRHGIPIDGWRLSGKTGTTQVRRITMRERETGIRREDELPWELRNHALFVCYAPEESPRYALSICVEHGGGGSSAAAPVARDIMLETLRLDPARKRPGEEPRVEDLEPNLRAMMEEAHATADMVSATYGPPPPPGFLDEDDETPISPSLEGISQ